MCSSYEHGMLTRISDPDAMILLMQLHVVHVTPPTDTFQITPHLHHYTLLTLAAELRTRKRRITQTPSSLQHTIRCLNPDY